MYRCRGKSKHAHTIEGRQEAMEEEVLIMLLLKMI